MTEEHKEKISIAKKGKISSFKGKHHTEKSKKKSSRSHKGQIHWNKRISSSEETKTKISKKNKGQIPWNKDKTYEETYGKKEAIKKKEYLSKFNQGKISLIKGKVLESIYGRKKANQIRKKQSLSHKGQIPWNKNKEDLKQKKIKNINQVVNVLKDVFMYDGVISKGEFFNSIIVKKKLGCCPTIRHSLQKEGLTLDDIAQEVGMEFKKRIDFIGKNETQILDEEEHKIGREILRQYSVLNFYIDGYEPIDNIAYEVDELHHKGRQKQDIIRENIIKEQLNCEFVRIKDGW